MWLTVAQDLHTIELEDFKYGGTNITSLRLINLDNPALQQLIRDWTTDIDDTGKIFGGEIVAGYSFAEVPNIFEVAASVNPQSSALLPDYVDQKFSSDTKNSIGSTEQPVQNFSVMPVRWNFIIVCNANANRTIYVYV